MSTGEDKAERIAKQLHELRRIATRERTLRAKQEETGPVDGYERVLRHLSHPNLGYEHVSNHGDKSPPVSPKTQVFVDGYRPDDATIKSIIPSPSNSGSEESDGNATDDLNLPCRPNLAPPVAPKFEFLSKSFEVRIPREIAVPKEYDYSNPPQPSLPTLLDESRHDNGLGQRRLPLPLTTMLPSSAFGMPKTPLKFQFQDEEKLLIEDLPVDSIARPRFLRKELDDVSRSGNSSPALLGEQKWNTKIIEVAEEQKRNSFSMGPTAPSHHGRPPSPRSSSSDISLLTKKRSNSNGDFGNRAKFLRALPRTPITTPQTSPKTTFKRPAAHNMPTPNTSPKSQRTSPLRATVQNVECDHSPYLFLTKTKEQLLEQSTRSLPTSPTFAKRQLVNKSKISPKNSLVTLQRRAKEKQDEAEIARLEFAEALLKLGLARLVPVEPNAPKPD